MNLYPNSIKMDRLTKRLNFKFDDMNYIFSLINEIDKLNTEFSLDNKLSPQ